MVTTLPIAVDDAYSVQEDNVLNPDAALGVLGNDTDVDGDSLTVEVTQQPQNGTLQLNADGSFSYTPTPNFTGTDSFNYRAFDGLVYSNPATVNISVLNANDSRWPSMIATRFPRAM